MYLYRKEGSGFWVVCGYGLLGLGWSRFSIYLPCHLWSNIFQALAKLFKVAQENLIYFYTSIFFKKKVTLCWGGARRTPQQYDE